jgi:hypothetical protein
MDGVLTVPLKGYGYSSRCECTLCSLMDSHSFPIFYRCDHRACYFWRGQTDVNKNTITGLVAGHHVTGIEFVQRCDATQGASCRFRFRPLEAAANHEHSHPSYVAWIHGIGPTSGRARYVRLCDQQYLPDLGSRRLYFIGIFYLSYIITS